MSLVMNTWRIVNYPEYNIDQLTHDAFTAKYEYYKTLKGNQTQQGYCRTFDKYYGLNINPELKYGGALFIKFHARAIIETHIDDHKGRSTVIAFPLSPNWPHFAPITYNGENIHYTQQPLALNTQVEHSVTNNNYDRYSYQLCFANTIDEIKELDLQNKIFV